jgi:hypothetical protein
MRTFGGTKRVVGAGLPPRPEGSRLLESPFATLWLLGDWPPDQVHVVEGPGWWCAVLGDISVDDAGLARQARRFAAGLDAEPLPVRGGNAHVVWADDAKLLVCGDRAGSRLVFHTLHSGLAHFASSAAVLADLCRSEIDDVWLALHLVSPDAIPGSMRSAFDDVVSVGPDSMLLIRDDQVGTPVSRPALEPEASLAEGATALREALESETRARLSGTVTADLSGGLDSSSVAAIAARTTTLTGLTLDAGQADNDDVAHAARIASRLPSLRHETRIIPDEVLPYSRLDDAIVTDEPWPDTVLYARTQWWHDELRALGSTVHLNGDGGDAVLQVVDRGGPRDEQDEFFAGLDLTLLRPARRNDKHPRPFPGWLRQRIEAIIWTLKHQLGLEQHRARIPTGLARVRILVAPHQHDREGDQPTVRGDPHVESDRVIRRDGATRDAPRPAHPDRLACRRSR